MKSDVHRRNVGCWSPCFAALGSICSRCWEGHEGSGFGPTDAFVREVHEEEFQECCEGDSSHDYLFRLARQAREQAKLKVRKSRMMSQTFASALSSKVLTSVRRASSGIGRSSSSLRRRSSREERDSLRESFMSLPSDRISSSWVGRTIKQTLGEWKGPASSDVPVWHQGNAQDLKVRGAGPRSQRKKQVASEVLPYGSMYDCVSCDAIKADTVIEDIVGNLVSIDQVPALAAEGGDRASLRWTQDCPLPRLICINLKLPYNLGSGDPGCSFVAFFHIKPEVLKELQSGNPRPCVRLFQRFCAGPMGRSGDKTDPARSLDQRRNRAKKVNADSGIFKANAWCENPSDVSVPSWMARWNGTPCTITKCGYVVKDHSSVGNSPGEWIEVGIDVRQFNWTARMALVSYRSKLEQASLHFGFMIQGEDVDELPEGLLCDMHIFGVSMDNDPLDVTST